MLVVVLTADRQSSSMKFNFPPKTGTGLAKHLPQASAECLDLLTGMLQYDPELRFSARQSLKHPYFKDLRDAEKRARAVVAEHGANATLAAAASMQVDPAPGMSSSLPTPEQHQYHPHPAPQEESELPDVSPAKPAKDAKVCCPRVFS